LEKSLTNLLKNNTRFEWTPAQEESFEVLKEKLWEKLVLQYPDFSKPFILTTDASGTARRHSVARRNKQRSTSSICFANFNR